MAHSHDWQVLVGRWRMEALVPYHTDLSLGLIACPRNKQPNSPRVGRTGTQDAVPDDDLASEITLRHFR